MIALKRQFYPSFRVTFVFFIACHDSMTRRTTDTFIFSSGLSCDKYWYASSVVDEI